MVNRADVGAGLDAAWAVLVGRTRPLDGLDLSFDGFWRSFAGPFLALPVYAIHVMAEYRLILGNLPEGAQLDETLFLLIRAAAFLADVAAFPLLAALLARPLGIAQAYVPLIVLFNWTAPLIAVPLALPSILLGAGVMGPGAATILLLMALVLAMTWRFRAARTALGDGGGLSAGIVTLDFLLSLVVGQAITGLLGP